MAKRLTEHHPLDKKLKKLEAFMQEIGIEIEWHGYDRMVVTDTETKVSAFYKDADGGSAVTQIPYFIEAKLVIED